MARRGFSQDRFAQVKKSLAEARGFKLGDDGIDYVLSQMLEALFNSKNIAEVYADDKALRKLSKENPDAAFYFDKVQSAKFFITQTLPGVYALKESIFSLDKSALLAHLPAYADA